MVPKRFSGYSQFQDLLAGGPKSWNLKTTFPWEKIISNIDVNVFLFKERLKKELDNCNLETMHFKEKWVSPTPNRMAPPVTPQIQT